MHISQENDEANRAPDEETVRSGRREKQKDQKPSTWKIKQSSSGGTRQGLGPLNNNAPR